MNITIVINKPAWSLGTLTRLICLGLPHEWRATVVSDEEKSSNPVRWERAIRSADVVHWMMHRRFPHDSPLTKSGHHLVTIHHLEDYEVGDRLDCLQRSEMIHVVSARYREEMILRGWPADRIEYIANPVDDTFFAEGTRDRKRNGERPFRIGFFASAEYEVDRKGIGHLPRISAGLTAAGVGHEIVVSGLGWNCLLATPDFRLASIKHTLSPSYFDMPRLYGSMDAYLCLSKIEGGPMVVFEALASGTPVVSTEVGAIPEYLRDGRDYCRVPIGDTDAAVAALAWIAGHPAKAAEMSRSGGAQVKARLSLSEYHDRFRLLYARLGGVSVPLPVRQAGRQVWLRRCWRAWDWSYWAKESWMAGDRKRALRLLAGSIILNPLGSGVWRIPVRAVARFIKHK